MVERLKNSGLHPPNSLVLSRKHRRLAHSQVASVLEEAQLRLASTDASDVWRPTARHIKYKISHLVPRGPGSQCFV